MSLSNEYHELMLNLGICLNCHDLFRTDLTSAEDFEDFCRQNCQDEYEEFVETL